MEGAKSIYERMADVAKKHGITVKPEDLRDADDHHHEQLDLISSEIYRAIIEVSEDSSDVLARDSARAMRKSLMQSEHRVTEKALAEEFRGQEGRI